VPKIGFFGSKINKHSIHHVGFSDEEMDLSETPGTPTERDTKTSIKNS